MSKRTVSDKYCYCRGTRIRTARGEVPVEELVIGDLVLTASGASRPVRSTGHRSFACTHHGELADIWPIRIQAGAFADGQPARDLWVSPNHSIQMEGVLLRAEELVNGGTIAQVGRTRLEYWHVGLDSSDIVIAEGLPSESEGPEVQRVKFSLLARAESLQALTRDSDVHIMADGQRIEPADPSAASLEFVLPAARAAIELRCRGFVPANVDPASEDRRVLGIRVNRLQLDGADVPLADPAVFEHGWHSLEQAGEHRWRWSHPSASLPAGTRQVTISMVGTAGYYQIDPKGSISALEIDRKYAPVKVTATPEVLHALGRIGQTEDVEFSPDNRWLALVGYVEDKVLLLNIELLTDGTEVVISDYRELSSPVFKKPHGVSWIDDDTLVVANREGEAHVLRIPKMTAQKSTEPVVLHTFFADESPKPKAPSSVRIFKRGPTLYDVLLCDNSDNAIFQATVDSGSSSGPQLGKKLLQLGLDGPDGIAFNTAGSWIAISNHHHNNVLLYKIGSGLDINSEPAGVLHGVNFPHGVLFTPDDRFILVADAGAPYVGLYSKESGADWSGDRDPHSLIRVMDDSIFRRTQNNNPEEGGPKGLALDKNANLLVTTSEAQSLAFFNFNNILANI
jgi:DNA-binding beta-propeller fold protein YncE